MGRYENAGREWLPRGKPADVLVHDFPDPMVNQALPYGVCDVTRDEGRGGVGIDHHTARFAAATIRRGWRKLGRRRHPNATSLLITADCGGGDNWTRPASNRGIPRGMERCD